MSPKAIWTIAIAAAVAVIVERVITAAMDKGITSSIPLDANLIPPPVIL